MGTIKAGFRLDRVTGSAAPAALLQNRVTGSAYPVQAGQVGSLAGIFGGGLRERIEEIVSGFFGLLGNGCG